MTCVHHCGIIQNSFTAQEIPCISYHSNTAFQSILKLVTSVVFPSRVVCFNRGKVAVGALDEEAGNCCASASWVVLGDGASLLSEPWFPSV